MWFVGGRGSVGLLIKYYLPKVGIKSTVDDFEVQVRYAPGTGTEGEKVSFNAATAIRVGSDRVAIYAKSGQPEIRVNGQSVVLDTNGDVLNLLGGGSISRKGDSILVSSPNGHEIIEAFLFADVMGEINVHLPGDRAGKMAGLLGNYDGNDINDFVSRFGQAYTFPLNRDQMYLEWGESWRIEQNESLFDYADGQSTYTFVDRSFPHGDISVEGLPPAARELGENTCRAKGISDPRVLESCIIDVGVTGNPGWADISKRIDPEAKRLNVAPLSATVLMNERVALSAGLWGNFTSKDLIWSTTGGFLEGSGNRVEFVAPNSSGEFIVTVRSTEDPTFNAQIPIVVTPVADVVPSKLAVNEYSNFILRSDAFITMLGENELTEQRDASCVPQSLPDLSQMVAIAANSSYGVGLKSDGTLWGWGSLDKAIPEFSNTTKNPVQLAGGHGWVSVVAAYNSLLALKRDGTVWFWAPYKVGQYQGLLKPVLVSGVNDVIRISSNAILKRDGTVWALSLDETFNAGDARATRVDGLTNIVSIASSGSSSISHGLALRSDGTVWTWGANDFGQLGDDSTIPRSIPQMVSGLTNIVSVSVSQYSSYVVNQDGSVWAWGSNHQKQLGVGDAQQVLVPTQLIGLTNVEVLSTSSTHAMALLRDGTLWSWGVNYDYNSGHCSSDPQGFVKLPTQIDGFIR
jgi:Regulator of chromosome condensation (RCC1) repeat/von Willebrand factor type D domain